MTGVHQIAVVIPARDEERLVGRCLESVLCARRLTEARLPGVRVIVVVVADSCTDATAAVARAVEGVTVVETDAANVGLARSIGVETAVALAGGADGLWIANTDADSVVPRRWLLEQVRLARLGSVTPRHPIPFSVSGSVVRLASCIGSSRPRSRRSTRTT